MKNQTFQQNLDQILGCIVTIQTAIAGMNYETFRNNEQIRQFVYSYLEQIGQAAAHLVQNAPEDLKTKYSLEALASLRYTEYQQQAEVTLQNTWMILTNDLLEVTEEMSGIPL